MSILPQPQNKSKPLFVFITKDYSGEGFAKLTKDAGYPVIIAHKIEEDEKEVEEFDLVANGIVPKIELDKIFKERNKFKEAYWIFDGNIWSDYSEKLRKEGFKVFGGMELTDKMEHDRAFGTAIIEKAGLKTPPTYEFSDIDKALDFLDQNEDKAFVFKPDKGEGCWTTYVPDSVKPEKANRELYSYMSSQNDKEAGTFILQERVDGVEANFEVFIYKGKPFFAWCSLECKRKLNHDEGEMVGSSQEIGFTIPLESKAIQNTVAKLFPYFRNYTGFLDMNVIVSDKQNYFLEFCARFGFSAHPNLFMNLALKSFPEIMLDWMEGRIDDFYKNFKFGFGAAINLYIDHNKIGYPIYVAPEMEDKFYHFGTFKEDNDEENEYSLSGYSTEIGIVMAHAYTIQDAAKQCLKNVDKIIYPCHACRTDLDQTDYEMSPQKRFEALKAMNYL